MKNTENNKELFRRYLDDLYTEKDAHQIMDEISQADNQALLEELSANVWDESIIHQPLTGLEREQYKKEARNLLKRIEHKKRTWLHRIIATTISAAAVVCLIVGGVKLLNHLNEKEISYIVASTSYGERKEISLPDGTQLVLNSCSRVRYPDHFLGEERKIELEGEGYFQVYRNEEKPFKIKTQRFNVLVLGTCFDVKSYSSDEIVSVEVESGKVQVDLPEAMMKLRAKEQVIINTVSGEYSKRREERPVAIWQKGGLRFHSTPIRDVAKELERMYNCRITFAHGLFNNLISGEHDNKSLESVLQSIEYTSGIRYKKEGNHILLYK